MQSVETIRHLFSYNDWANRRLLESLNAQSRQPQKAVRALAHLVIAERTWLMRILRGEDNTGFNFWPDASLKESEALAEETTKAYREMLEDLTEEGLEAIATYKNSKGVEYKTTYRDILMHVLMHSMYHRGQVAMAMRAEGEDPAYTDYIGYVREREG